MSDRQTIIDMLDRAGIKFSTKDARIILDSGVQIKLRATDELDSICRTYSARDEG